jgi:peptidyl-prolyl cis-trans isomerase D
MLSDAFSLPQGGETDITSLGKGEYYALRVEKVTPSALPTLEEVKPQLTRAWIGQQFMKRLQDKGAALAARIKKGESVDAVAASAGAKVEHVDGLSLAVAAQQQQTLGQEFLGKLFQAKTGDVFQAIIPGTGLAVVKVAAIRPGGGPQVAGLTQTARLQLTQQMNAKEFGDVVEVAARNFVKPKVDEKLARTAIGVQPDQGGPASSSSPAKTPAQ